MHSNGCYPCIYYADVVASTRTLYKERANKGCQTRNCVPQHTDGATRVSAYCLARLATSNVVPPALGGGGGKRVATMTMRRRGFDIYRGRV